MTTNWLRQIKTGDHSAWERLSRVYRKLVIWWCLRGDVPRNDAEDLAQEVFVSVQGGIKNYRHDSFRGWLWTITRARIADYWRAHAKRPAVAGGNSIDDILEQVEADSGRQVDELDQATKVLFDEIISVVKAEFNDTHWRAFWLRVVESRPAAEVAEELQITRTVVHNATSRIRRRINDVFPSTQPE